MIQLQTGSQVLKIDSQGRIKLPIANVEYFKSRGKLVMSLDFQSPCLFVMPLSIWEDKAAKLMQLPSHYPEFRQIKRRVIGNARECEIDNNARLAIPKILRDMIEIEHACVFVAQGTKFEIFSETKWLEISQKELDLTNIPRKELSKYASELNL